MKKGKLIMDLSPELNEKLNKFAKERMQKKAAVVRLALTKFFMEVKNV